MGKNSPEVRARARIKEKAQAVQNIQNGWCRFHEGTKSKQGSTLCEKCSDSRYAIRQRSIKNGKCRNHHTKDARPGHKTCQDCANKGREKLLSRKANNFCCNHPQTPTVRGTWFCGECCRKNCFKRIKKVYGLSEQKYLSEASLREFRCDLCQISCESIGSGGKESKTKIFQVDHDHTTGKLRGLLCHQCNIYIGQYADDLSRIHTMLQNLPHYLSDQNKGIIPNE